MITRSWIRNLFARTPRTARKAPARCRPRLEFLEDRLAPAVIGVTSTDDTLHYSPTVMISDLNPATTSITLRDATNAANNTGGSNVIELAANTTYIVSPANVDNVTNGPNALPAISSNITIEGNGAILHRTGTGTTTADALRFFYVAGGLSGQPAGTLTLHDLTLENGLASGAGASANGGAIYSQGTLTLDTVTVMNNRAQGAAAFGGIVAGSGGAACGGGLYVATGSATLSNDTFSDNTAQGGSGGDGNYGNNGGNGGTGSGGALYVAGGRVTLSNDTLSDNTAQGGSGGNGGEGFIVGGGTFFFAGGNGGTGSGGGLYMAGGRVTLSNDTLSGNTVKGGSGGAGDPSGNGGAACGGGLEVAAGLLLQSNSTLSDNTAHGGSGAASVSASAPGGTGGAGSGGGVYGAGGSILTLINDTLSGNSAQGGTGGAGNSAGLGGSGTGGGVFLVGGSRATVTNTLIAQNTVTGGSASAPDVSGNVAGLYNLVGDGTGSNLRDGVNGNQVGNTPTHPGVIDPKLGPLYNNGGPTPTMALLPGSPAIDKGNNSFIPYYQNTDQRGFPRVVNGTVDIGAFEVQPLHLGTDMLVEGPAAGTDSVLVTGGGAWNASSQASWLHISPSGTGRGVATFTFDANPGATRSGTLTIAGQPLTVVQAGSSYVAANALTTLTSSALSQPNSVAVDAAGNVYISDQGDNTIKEWHATTGQVTTLVSLGQNAPGPLAVDAAGNLYITVPGANAVEKWTAATGRLTSLVSLGQNSPIGVALDRWGTLYIAVAGPQDTNNSIAKWNASTGQVTTLVSLGSIQPFGLAMDAAGNFYFADANNGGAIYEWNAATGLHTLVSSGLNHPFGLAVDGSGNVYIAESLNNAVKEWHATTGQVTTLVSSGLFIPGGVAVDGVGNVYIADTYHGALKELPRAFVPGAAIQVQAPGGAFVLAPVLPTTESLTGVFAPSSDQNWLIVGPIQNGQVPFKVTANSGPARTAHLTVLGQPITITQAAGGGYDIVTVK
jgi:sugar lactone lactonase YvrE